MRILVIGCSGQLGKDMVRILSETGHVVSATDFPAINVADPAGVDAVVKDSSAEVIVNCAAFTAVDACETRRDEAYAVNAAGTGHIARSALDVGARVIHFSTDYVFDGDKNTPYIESDAVNPRSQYGKSKLEGERLLASIAPDHVILRVAWLYGVHGNHFIKKIKARALSIKGTGQPLRVVTDEIGTPTYTVDVCRQTLRLLQGGARGILHCTSEGYCSRFEFAQEIIKAYGLNIPLVPCTSKEFILPAPRPAYSVLENKRLKELGINVMRDWKTAFAEYIEEESKGSKF